jgi:hypothetical protein
MRREFLHEARSEPSKMTKTKPQAHPETRVLASPSMKFWETSVLIGSKLPAA